MKEKRFPARVHSAISFCGLPCTTQSLLQQEPESHPSDPCCTGYWRTNRGIKTSSYGCCSATVTNQTSTTTTSGGVSLLNVLTFITCRHSVEAGRIGKACAAMCRNTCRGSCKDAQTCKPTFAGSTKWSRRTESC